ncbi:hypothetical protein N1937_02045 [Rhizobium sp. WSM4643]|uniref:hypothetical protein n=1 Tax=Rhizobium sp. WSM4643 TaxID=3138253 RepID=UPI0021A82636|nr:hypothetical protein [Rhizobium leguminosarum]UWM76054.1 hypothetical protein N1937_02045 [Rhizobium leguminosarum bv. viciae]
MNISFSPWTAEPDVFGEAASMWTNERFLDLTMTPTKRRRAVWDVLDGGEKIAEGEADSPEAAKAEAVVAARRGLFTIVK